MCRFLNLFDCLFRSWSNILPAPPPSAAFRGLYVWRESIRLFYALWRWLSKVLVISPMQDSFDLSRKISDTGEFANRSSLPSSVFVTCNNPLDASADTNTPVWRASIPSSFCNSFNVTCLPPYSFVNNSSSTAAINALDAKNPIRVWKIVSGDDEKDLRDSFNLTTQRDKKKESILNFG